MPRSPKAIESGTLPKRKVRRKEGTRESLKQANPH